MISNASQRSQCKGDAAQVEAGNYQKIEELLRGLRKGSGSDWCPVASPVDALPHSLLGLAFRFIGPATTNATRSRCPFPVVTTWALAKGFAVSKWTGEPRSGAGNVEKEYVRAHRH